MEHESKKNPAAIDEQHLMSIIAGDVNPETRTTDLPVDSKQRVEDPHHTTGKMEVPKRKKRKVSDYEELFVRSSDTNARNGKSVTSGLNTMKDSPGLSGWSGATR